MSFDYMIYDDEDNDIQGCIMLIPKDENYEEIKKKKSAKKQLQISLDPQASGQKSVRTPILAHTPSKQTPKEDQKMMKNFSQMLSKVDDDTALNFLQNLMNNIQNKKQNEL